MAFGRKYLNKQDMKASNKLLLKAIAVFLGVLLSYSAVFAQKNDSSTANLIQSKYYVFKVQTILPTGGNIRHVTSDYDLTISGDSLISYLPYFGRAYMGVDPNDGGLNFTSTNFGYSIQNRKKGGWDIVITPKDTKDVRTMTFNISENGYGSLQVISNNRSAISYNGYVAEPRKKK